VKAISSALERVVEPEELDHLAPDDVTAQRSRRDLRRVHRAMRTRAILVRALDRAVTAAKRSASLRILELGAGDGTLMLGVARVLAPRWPAVKLSLLDRQALVADRTVADYAVLGWEVQLLTADVLDWVSDASDASNVASNVASSDASSDASSEPPPRWDLIVTNLFLHHFEEPVLRRLLAAVAARTEVFFACEPRRAWVALAGSHLVGALGANAVTRGDAVLSVHAGFRGAELTALWPAAAGRWRIEETPAGWFSHCFCASRCAA
jgi:hypothetical protein